MAHHVPGRIRIKFDPAIIAAPQAEVFSKWWQEKKSQGNGLSKVVVTHRFNMASRSLVLEYDRKRVDFKLLDELFNSNDLNRVTSLINQLAEDIGLDN
ncbi:hypothetical protein X474_04125 [Dethiosulfatarculus sandiegensis]|uniref:Uncharacterized protein n=1 Tax=Dethiosulfatarculus sandiegensis TaxID=1429043 RepID=A0A0D2JBG6_9BACT|nr:hypothetical protein X474_04125 [Dethiosulfatarculus sandiegensis]